MRCLCELAGTADCSPAGCPYPDDAAERQARKRLVYHSVRGTIGYILEALERSDGDLRGEKLRDKIADIGKAALAERRR